MGATHYEVHEQIRGRFIWHAFDDDGNVVDSWAREASYRSDPREGDESWSAAGRPGDTGRPVGEKVFPTVGEAHAYCKEQGWKDRTRYSKLSDEDRAARLAAIGFDTPIEED